MSPQEYAQELFIGSNEVRIARGLPTLKWNSCAEAQALERAKVFAAGDVLEHAPLEPVFDTCPEWKYVAENLSQTDAPPNLVFEGWAASPKREYNLLNPRVEAIGIACNPVDGVLTCSQIILGKERQGS